jgi:hypothetical protein
LATAAGVTTALAACGHLWQTTTTPTPAPAPDVYACAVVQVTAMGYKVVSDTVHREQRDLEASKTLPRGSVGADPNEYDRKDVLSIIVTGSGSGSTMRVVAGTVGIEENRRGPTDVDEPAGVNVLADADSVVARCRVASPPTTKT